MRILKNGTQTASICTLGDFRLKQFQKAQEKETNNILDELDFNRSGRAVSYDASGTPIDATNFRPFEREDQEAEIIEVDFYARKRIG